jgi:hypothetical protein
MEVGTDNLVALQDELDSIEFDISEMQMQLDRGHSYTGDERLLDDLIADRDDLIARIEALGGGEF